MDETMTMDEMTSVDVYDPARLPHYGAIDFSEGSETVELSALALRVYSDSCAAWADDEVDINCDRLSCDLQHAQAGSSASLHQVIAQLDPLRAGGLRRQRSFHGINTHFKQHAVTILLMFHLNSLNKNRYLTGYLLSAT